MARRFNQLGILQLSIAQTSVTLVFVNENLKLKPDQTDYGQSFNNGLKHTLGSDEIESLNSVWMVENGKYLNFNEA